MIKIWVDDRLKTVPKLQVNVYEAIIDEAHKNGMRVVAHIFNLEDGKQLLKSGVDGFGHGVRDRDVDEEYLTLLKQHPRVWVGPNLPPRTTDNRGSGGRDRLGERDPSAAARSSGCATSWRSRPAVARAERAVR